MREIGRRHHDVSAEAAINNGGSDYLFINKLIDDLFRQGIGEQAA